MLVLNRKKGEQIIFGDDLITVTVIGIQGDKVRLGIDAPRALTVHRKEVLDRIRKTSRNGLI